MAKEKDIKETAEPTDKAQAAQSLKPQGSEDQKKGKKNGFLFGFFAFLTALIIMTAVVGGAFFIVIHNNVNGLGEKYRKDIQGIPLLKMALPKVADPDDPKYLTEDEIKKRYQELRKTKEDLTKQLEASNKKVEELQKVKEEQDTIKAENEKVKKDADAQKAAIEEEKKKLQEDKKKVDELVAAGDKEGLRDYFEKMDPETAKAMYVEILEEQKASEDAKKFAKLYESMDSSAAASVMEKLGTSKINLVVDILRYMKKEVAAEILAAMTPDYAAKVTERLSKYYLYTPKPASAP